LKIFENSAFQKIQDKVQELKELWEFPNMGLFLHHPIILIDNVTPLSQLLIIL